MSFTYSSRFESDCRDGVRDRDMHGAPMIIRKGRVGIRFGLAAAVVCGCLVGAQGMQYEPFRFCLEKAKVDSSRTLIWQDKGLGVPPPYKEVELFQYQPASCLPTKTVSVYDSGSPPDTKMYTQRPGERVVDYSQKLESGVTVAGTEFYSASGKLDSSYYTETVTDEMGKEFKSTSLQRFVSKPDYELVQTYFSYFDEPFRFTQGDSIVANDSGVTVYSRGDHENRVTECVDRGDNYVCMPTQVEDLEDRFKQIWFLNQGRPDSLQVFMDDGTLYYSKTYFWSSRPEGAAQVRNPGSAKHRATEPPAFYFDLRGRRLGNGQGAKVSPRGLVPGISPSRD